MNIKKFNITLHQILFGLLISSGLPGLIKDSVLFEALDLNLRFNLYIFGLFIREFFIFLLGLKILLILFKKINLGRIRYRALIAFLPLIPIILLVIYDFRPILFITGIRFYILFSLPLLVLEENSNFNFKRNIIINDFIFYLYLVLNILSFTIGYDGLMTNRDKYGDLISYALIGETFLGARYAFISVNPIIAAQQFGIFLIYANFRLIIEKSNFEKTKFLIISIILMYLTLYTGGRAGTVVAFIACISSIIIYFFPKIKYIFLTQKKLTNKFFTISTLIVSSIIFFILSSSPLISGRPQTQTEIQNKGLVEGIYESRLLSLKFRFDESKIEDVIFGKPGLGTNTACNKVTSAVTSDECKTTDSLPLTSLFSFGIFGILLYIVIFIVVTNISYSPLMTVAFFVFSLSQIFPEIILPWTQFVLIIFHSKQKENINKFRNSKP